MSLFTKKPPPLTTLDLYDSMQRVADMRPFLAIALYSLTPRPIKDFGTLAVSDKLDLLFDPEVEWRGPALDAVVYHEVGHIIADHAGRFKTLHAKGHAIAQKHKVEQASLAAIWNVAADCEINDDLISEGIQLPGDPALPRKFNLPDGMLAEEYFDHLLKNAKRIDVTQLSVGKGECGGCAGHPSNEEVVATARATNAEEQEDKQRVDRIRDEVADKIMKAAAEKDRRDKRAGNSSVPDSWILWARRRVATNRSWRYLLANLVKRDFGRARGMTDYSFSKQSRRSSPGILLPGFVGPRQRIAVVLDISGSMAGEPSTVSLNAVDEIINAAGVDDLVVIPTNTRALEPIRVRKARHAKIPFNGGTNMTAGIDRAMELRPRPDIVVVITDGETPWPSRNVYPFPVAAAIVEDAESYHNMAANVPSWIKTINVII